MQAVNMSRKLTGCSTGSKLKRLNMYKEGKAVRNKEGKIVQAASFQSRDIPTAVIEPNRKWFTNTRVISQDTLKSFREAIAEKDKDPYQVLLKSNKLPLSLIRDGQDVNGIKQHQAKMTIESSPFSEVFGPKMQRKRVKLGSTTIEDLAEDSGKSLEKHVERLEQIKFLNGQLGGTHLDGSEAVIPEEDFSIATAKEAIFSKGQSKRIWNELYKVIDSSDVILHVLDARDPLGTRCRSVEKYLREEAPHKHLVFVINKTDLVPTSVAANWVRALQKEYPTCAFKANMKNSFGRGSLIQLLRQFSILHKDRKQISVGLIGYPNTGKSSIINTLRGKKVCTIAPIPGETKVWQYVTLMKRIFLIDCPGIVPPNQNDTPEDILLRGVVRVENVENPEQYIPAVLRKCKKHHVERTYELTGWDDHIQFLELLARKGGRLLKAGEPDLDAVAKMVLNDFMRGKIPWFTSPPKVEEGSDEKIKADRSGRLGEMPLKRKRDDADASTVAPTSEKGEEDGDETFGGFEDDEDEDSEDEDEDGGANVESTKGKKKKAEVQSEEADEIPLEDSDDEDDIEDDMSEISEESFDDDIEEEPRPPPKKRRSGKSKD
ncbi:GTPase required for pre-60S ribosomal subunit nuclear export and maturation [Coniochaeta pulveracea]|uniref:Nucleolar GTP-binding protein 2 n=1 Tax=Coniochaeta pulveracea TaxID=177199 RepID=A0A420YKJ2_9PEZI|nr:GTPase required for pre-60S ribosomal subunit nuclear export and maturation [Coniochaeta pulveracea]